MTRPSSARSQQSLRSGRSRKRPPSSRSALAPSPVPNHPLLSPDESVPPLEHLARIRAPIGALLQLLSCSACSKTLSKPARLLTCHHVLCSACVSLSVASGRCVSNTCNLPVRPGQVTRAPEVARIAEAVAALGNFKEYLDEAVRHADAKPPPSASQVNFDENDSQPCRLSLRVRTPPKQPLVRLVLRIRPPVACPLRLRLRPPRPIRSDTQTYVPADACPDEDQTSEDLERNTPITEDHSDEHGSPWQREPARAGVSKSKALPVRDERLSVSSSRVNGNDTCDAGNALGRAPVATDPSAVHLPKRQGTGGLVSRPSIPLRLRVRSPKHCPVGKAATPTEEPIEHNSTYSPAKCHSGLPEGAPGTPVKDTMTSNERDGHSSRLKLCQEEPLTETPTLARDGPNQGEPEANVDNVDNSSALRIACTREDKYRVGEELSPSQHIEEERNTVDCAVDTGIREENDDIPTEAVDAASTPYRIPEGPYYLCVSGIGKDLQAELADELITRLGGEYTSGFGGSTYPHCVVTSLNAKTNAIENRTMIIHEALARCVPIVSFGWLVNCFQAGMWLETSSFEASPRRRRDGLLLFRGVVATFDSEFENSSEPLVQKAGQDITRLMKLGGARIADSEQLASLLESDSMLTLHVHVVRQFEETTNACPEVPYEDKVLTRFPQSHIPTKIVSMLWISDCLLSGECPPPSLEKSESVDGYTGSETDS